MSLLSGLSSTYARIRNDPFAFCEFNNFKPTAQQGLVLRAVQKALAGEAPKRIAVKSGQGPGKTTISVMIAWFLQMRAVDAMCVVTAPTMRQCNEVWLAEARRLLKNAHPLTQSLIDIKGTRIEFAGRREWAIKTVTATDEKKAQGFHEKNMSIICEEASGIPRAIIEQYKGTASNPNCIFLMIGNPNTRDCAFFDCFNSQRHLWQTITLNAEETPKSEWFDPLRNEQLAEEYGRESDVYRVRVLGEFPHSDPNCVMSSEDVERCTDPKLKLPLSIVGRLGKFPPAKQFGLDFARFGGDESTIFRRVGNSIAQWEAKAHVEPARVIEKAFLWQMECHWKNADCLYVADAGGIGQGLMHKFHDADKHVVEFHNNGKSSLPRQYGNKVSQAWFHLGKLVKARQCYIPNDNRLIQQLTTRQYFMDKKGAIVLESKDEYMKRGFDSPDRADGCVNAFWDDAITESKVATRD